MLQRLGSRSTGHGREALLCQHSRWCPAEAPAASPSRQVNAGLCAADPSFIKVRRQLSVSASAQAAQHATPAKRRVVVTGTGVVSPLGHEVDEFYGALLEGRSGVSRIEGFDAGDFSTRIAGEIKEFTGDGYIDKRSERRLDSFLKYAIVAGKKALASAGIAWADGGLESLDPMRCGILIGSAMGGMKTFSAAIETLHVQGLRKMNPFCIPFSIHNMAGALLAMDLGFMGPNYPINTACATGNYCILSAAQHIERGDADLMLTGGSEAAVIPSGIGGFIACKALSRRNDAPESASRPWDKGRDGFVMGEGAGVVVLEELEHARARGAPILAEFIGGSFTSDAYHLTDPRPDGAGVSRCIEQALERTGVSADDVSYVNAHGTSTPVGDMAEYRAIRAAIPGPQLRINSTKGMIGHLLGAAGAVEAVAVIEAIQTGWVHPNINLDDPEGDVELEILVGSQKQQMDIKVALSNSFGFGGHNSCILFKAFDS